MVQKKLHLNYLENVNWRLALSYLLIKFKKISEPVCTPINVIITPTIAPVPISLVTKICEDHNKLCRLRGLPYLTPLELYDYHNKHYHGIT